MNTQCVNCWTFEARNVTKIPFFRKLGTIIRATPNPLTAKGPFLTAIAPNQRHSALPGQPAQGANGGRECDVPCEVIETSGDQPWAEFCMGLKEPAFLLAVTGFGDLE